MNDLFTFLSSSIQVIHVDAYQRLPHQVYCGRANPYYKFKESPLSNPIALPSENQRNKVCDAYGLYLIDKIENSDQAIMTELMKLRELYCKHGKLDLVCWCAPKRCHCDTIKHIMDTSMDTAIRNV